jgi:hypothetical protein
MDGDREFRIDIEACRELVNNGNIISTGERTIGPIKLQ